MASLTAPIIVVYVMIGLVIMALLVGFIWFRRRNIGQAFTVHASPPEGVYSSPLRVELETSNAGESIFVQAYEEGNAVEKADAAFMQYAEPLLFDRDGAFIVEAYAATGTTCSDVRRFRFVCQGGKPAAPIITPSSGEVTTKTRIAIDLQSASRSATIHYSIGEGTHPSVQYGGPFTLDAAGVIGDYRGAGHQRYRLVTVRAVAVFGHHASEVTEAQLRVVPHGTSLFDPQIAAPIGQAEVVDAQLILSHPDKSAVMYFQVETEQQSVRGDTVPETHVYRGEALKVTKEVSSIVAWAADPNDASRRGRIVRYDASMHSTDTPSDPPAPGVLEAPTLYLAASGVELTFVDPPPRFEVLYTLDGTDPDPESEMSTKRYSGLQSIKVGRGEHTTVDLVAKCFTRQPDGDGVSRFGWAFRRQFYLK